MKKKYKVTIMLTDEELVNFDDRLSECIDEIEDYVTFSYEDKIIQIPRELLIMLNTMDYCVLGVA